MFNIANVNNRNVYIVFINLLFLNILIVSFYNNYYVKFSII